VLFIELNNNKPSFAIHYKSISFLTESVSGEESTKSPAHKRSRLLGDLDIDDPEVQKILNAKSSHAAALTQVQNL
jgi:hypothetical protein